jgi:hypothetical protein
MYCLSSVEPSASLFTGTATFYLMLYLSDIVLSIITSVVLLVSKMSSFSHWIAQFCWCASQFSLNSSWHDIKPLHWKAVLWSSYFKFEFVGFIFLALKNSHQSELIKVSLLNKRIMILGQYTHQYSTCFGFTCVYFFVYSIHCVNKIKRNTV